MTHRKLSVRSNDQTMRFIGLSLPISVEPGLCMDSVIWFTIEYPSCEPNQ